jgi:hypothetical protein
LWLGDEMMAELNQESGVVALEIYSRQDGQPWTVAFDQFIDCALTARSALRGNAQE